MSTGKQKTNQPKPQCTIRPEAIPRPTQILSNDFPLHPLAKANQILVTAHGTHGLHAYGQAVGAQMTGQIDAGVA